MKRSRIKEVLILLNAVFISVFACANDGGGSNISQTVENEVEQIVDEEGRYFIQDFEDQSTYPGTDGKDANVEQTFNFLGGEWIYYNTTY